MDESFDIDHFEIPLNEKKTYSIIEVFQVNIITSTRITNNYIEYYFFLFFSFGNKYLKKHLNNIDGYHVHYLKMRIIPLYLNYGMTI